MSTGFKRLVEKIHAIDQEIQLGKDADWIKQEIEDVCRQLDPFCKKAEIVDPENRIYSDSMIQRIKEAKIHADRVLEKALEYWEKAQIVKEQERQELQRKLDLLEKERVERETKEREAQRIAEELKAKAEEEKRIRDQMIREKEEEEKRIRDKWQREKYETERDIREQRKKAEKLEMLERERRIEEAKSSSVQDIAEKLVDWNPDDDEIPIMMFRTLLNIVSNILAAPENPQFRHIRIENEHIQRDLTNHLGGIEALMCLGFREKDLTVPTKEKYYVLEEPNTELEMEKWVEWFDRLTLAKQIFESKISNH